jgi:hypothetical protein
MPGAKTLAERDRAEERNAKSLRLFAINAVSPTASLSNRSRVGRCYAVAASAPVAHRIVELESDYVEGCHSPETTVAHAVAVMITA